MIGGKTVEQVLKITPVLSPEMEHEIAEWTDMYKNKAPWLKEPTMSDPSRIVSLGLPSLIASEKARMAVLEWQSDITAPTVEIEEANEEYEAPQKDEFGNLIPTAQPATIKEQKPVGSEERAKFLNEQYKKLKKHIRKQLEYGIAKGGLVIKPYVVINENTNGTTIPKYSMEFDFIQADAFYPIAFNASGEITEAAFIQTKAEKDVTYRRLEYHKLEGNKVTVINRAFKSTENNGNTGPSTGVELGQEIPLTTVYEWKDLKPKVVIEEVTKPLFAYFKMPEANTIDPNSPLGVSGYSRAKQLIKDADMQYSRLLWEYEGGELAIAIDRDALKFVEETGSTLTHFQSRIYRRVDIGEEDLYQPYAPSLRDSAYIQGLNTILMRIEDATGLSRGTLSEDNMNVARTATELKILKQRSFSTNAEIQHALEDALRDVIYVMNTYCSLYQITPEGEYDVSFEWDDSILVDAEAELENRIILMQNGLAGRLENRMWYFGETERQATEALIQIDSENLKTMETELAREYNQNRMENTMQTSGDRDNMRRFDVKEDFD